MTCKTCGLSPHFGMRTERVFAGGFNALFHLFEIITFARS